MQSVKFDPEILYVQKLYFFLYLLSFCLLISLILLWRVDWKFAGLAFAGGTLVSYIVMARKKNFPPPERKLAAIRMAREISQDTSPLTISRFASQLYYYFHEPRQAISLLEKFLKTDDPLLCATLADILLKEGRPKQALMILRENPFVLTDPLLLATQGHILNNLGRIQDAVRLYERSLRLAGEQGFPHNGASWLTQKFLTISYTACIHHALADCYMNLKDFPAAKRHYRAGNRRLIDITFWKHPSGPYLRSTKNYSESR